MKDYKKLAEAGEYPRCYKSHPPFYNLCAGGERNVNRKQMSRTSSQQILYLKCAQCIKINEFYGHEKLLIEDEEDNARRSARERAISSYWNPPSEGLSFLNNPDEDDDINDDEDGGNLF